VNSSTVTRCVCTRVSRTTADCSGMQLIRSGRLKHTACGISGFVQLSPTLQAVQHRVTEAVMTKALLSTLSSIMHKAGCRDRTHAWLAVCQQICLHRYRVAAMTLPPMTHPPQVAFGSFIRSFVHSFARSCMHAFSHSFIHHSFIHSSMHRRHTCLPQGYIQA